MMMRVWNDEDKVLDVVFSNATGTKIKGRIKLDGVSRLMYMPSVSPVVTPLVTKNVTKLQKTAHMQIDGQTYLGSVKSLVTDAVVDIYYIKREFNKQIHTTVGNDVVTTNVASYENFFLIIPSTIFHGETKYLPNHYTIEINGVVSGVNDMIDTTRGLASSIVRLEDKTVATYIEDKAIVSASAVVKLESYVYPGLTNDNIITSSRLKTTDNTLISKYGATQFIVLENMKTLIPTLTEVELGRIKPDKILNMFKIGDSVKYENDVFNVAIPYNF